ncbi:MAG: hypothetical protein U1E60_23150 [Reyranellaceae bacterium]
MKALVVVGHPALGSFNHAPADLERDTFGDPLVRMWRDCVLGYCGVGQVVRALFGVVPTSTAARSG